MTLITSSNDVDPIKMTIFGFRLLPLRSKLRHFSFYNLTGWSLEISNLCTVLKNHEPVHVHVKHGKCIFVPQSEYSRIRTINLNLITQKGGRVVQMIIAHKRFHIIYILKKMKAKNEIALALELSIVTFSTVEEGFEAQCHLSFLNFQDH